MGTSIWGATDGLISKNLGIDGDLPPQHYIHKEDSVISKFAGLRFNPNDIYANPFKEEPGHLKVPFTKQPYPKEKESSECSFQGET